DGRIWILPAARAKGKLDVVIPLSKAAQKIIAAQPERGPYVFGPTGQKPLTDFARRKAAFDRICGVTGYHIHDLRRSARSLLSRVATPDIAERCLGHVITGVRGTYDRHQF